MACDQIAIQIPKTRWKEGSAFTATAYFRNRDAGAADAPGAVRYRIDCLTSRKTILDWTDETPAASLAIAISAAHNVIECPGNAFEVKQLTIDATDECRQAITWRVENLYGSR